MKKYSLVHEGPEHFVVHDGEASFQVAKKGLDKDAVAKIQGLAKGGEPSKKIPYKDLISEHEELVREPSLNPRVKKEQSKELQEYKQELHEKQNYSDGGNVLDANARAHIAPKNFALPGGRYPIHDIVHARNALARVAQHGTPEEKSRVRAAVHSKFPSIGKAEGGKVGDEHDPENLHALVKSFDKFIEEEGGENYDLGGAVEHRMDRLHELKGSVDKFLERGYDTGGQVPATEDAVSDFQDSFRKKLYGHSDGGEIQSFYDAGRVNADGSPMSKEDQDAEAAYFASQSKRVEGPSARQDLGISVPSRNKYGSPDIPAVPPSDIQSASKSTSLAGGGEVVPNDLSRDPKETQRRQEAEADKVKEVTSTPYANYGRTDQGGVQPVNVTYHFYHGGNVPTHAMRMADGGGVPSVTLSAADLAGPGALAAQPSPPPTQSGPTEMESMQNLGAQVPPQVSPPVPPVQPPQSQQTPPPPSAAPYQDTLKATMDAQQAMESGIKGTSQAQQALAQQNAKLLNDFQIREQTRQMLGNQEEQELKSHLDDMYNQVLSNKINPNRVMQNMDTGAKIRTGLALFFGGIGSGITGQPNVAAQFLERTIQNDIEAQKTDQSNRMNLYRVGLERYRDETAAEQYASLQAHNILAAQMQQAANQIGTPLAKAAAQQQIAQLQLNMLPVIQNLKLQGAAIRMMGDQQGGGGQSAPPQAGPNLPLLDVMHRSGLIDNETHKDAVKEVGDYSKAKDLLDKTDEIFDKGANAATYTERFLPSWIPTIRESSKQYEGLTGPYMDKMTKDLSGRVSPEAVKLIQKALPVAGDDPKTIEIKRNNIKDIIKGAFSFPTLQEHGIISSKDPLTITEANKAENRRKFQVGPPVGVK